MAMRNRKKAPAADAGWTHFWDMNSGGGRKEKWNNIYIEAPEEEAKIIFYNRFGHSPERVSCTCCGSDYSISSGTDLAQLTGFHRGLRCVEARRNPKTKLYDNDDPNVRYLEPGEEPPAGYNVSSFSLMRDEATLTVEQYEKKPDVLVIRSADIKAEERRGSVPSQGYVWVD